MPMASPIPSSKVNSMVTSQREAEGKVVVEGGMQPASWGGAPRKPIPIYLPHESIPTQGHEIFLQAYGQTDSQP